MFPSICLSPSWHTSSRTSCLRFQFFHYLSYKISHALRIHTYIVSHHRHCPLHSMHLHLCFRLLLILIISPFGFFFLTGDECKVHIDNRHTELKELINNQSQFTWTNWSHLISLLIVVLLSCLLLFAYCYIKVKCWPTLKHAHVPFSTPHRPSPSSPYDAPYIIQMPDRTLVQQVPPRPPAHDDT